MWGGLVRKGGLRGRGLEGLTLGMVDDRCGMRRKEGAKGFTDISGQMPVLVSMHRQSAPPGADCGCPQWKASCGRAVRLRVPSYRTMRASRRSHNGSHLAQ